MRVNKTWLKKFSACDSGQRWYLAQNFQSDKEGILGLHNNSHNDWANWVLVRLMNKKQRIQYAIFAAELVLDNFERRYPEDKRPRLAIEAAKKAIKNNTKQNRSAAWSAAESAWSAAWSARSAAESAAESAARSAMQVTILNYGIRLLKLK